jgi:2-polyprenyl-3-methyl-5-hydroxy-6-metoxy-1,4-benzoquinol methylase
MNKKLLSYLGKKPEVYETTEFKFWDDPHISKGMLAAHLNTELESATRKYDFIVKSVNWINELTAANGRKKLLDLGCGPGIYAELFAEKGFDVTGIDISQRSINYAKESSEKKGLNINYQMKSYLEMDYTEEFDVITLIYCDFGVLNTEMRELLLKKIYKALKPEGILIFDVFSEKEYQMKEENTNWTYSNGGYWSTNPYACLYSFQRYEESSVFLEQYVIIEEDNVKCYNLWNHGFNTEELSQDLNTAGFDKINFYDDVSGKNFTGENNVICITAYK